MGITIGAVFILLIPLVYLGSYLFGLKGLFAGIALAYFITGIVSDFILKQTLNKLKTKEQV